MPSVAEALAAGLDPIHPDTRAGLPVLSLKDHLTIECFKALRYSDTISAAATLAATAAADAAALLAVLRSSS